MEHESDVYTNYNWCSWYIHRRIIKGTGGLENKRTSGDHPNYYIIETGQNNEKSSGDLRRLAVTQTSERPSANADVKNSQEVNNNNSYLAITSSSLQLIQIAHSYMVSSILCQY